MVFPVVGQGFVEFSVLILADVIGIAGPDGFGLVQLFIFAVLFLDGLLLFLLDILVGVFVFTDILNLGFLFIGFIIADFQVAFLLYQQFDWVANKLRVLLHNLLDAFLLNVVHLIFLQVEDDPGTAANWFTMVWSDGERASG